MEWKDATKELPQPINPNGVISQEVLICYMSNDTKEYIVGIYDHKRQKWLSRGFSLPMVSHWAMIEGPGT